MKVLLVFLLMVFTFCGSSPSARETQADILKVASFDSPEMAAGAPAGWTLQQYRGEAAFKMEQDEAGVFLRMDCRGDMAFGVKKEFSVDLAVYPFLNWRWRVHKLPPGGDIRHADRDDQALQIYAIFKKTGMQMAFQPPTLSYIWDHKAPRGLAVKSPQRLLGKVRYVVLRNGTDTMGQWYSEKRNLLEDGLNAFPEFQKEASPRPVQGLLLFINTHHTKGEANGDIGNLYFSRK